MVGSTPAFSTLCYLCSPTYVAPLYKHMRGWWWLTVHKAGSGEWLSGWAHPCNASKVAGSNPAIPFIVFPHKKEGCRQQGGCPSLPRPTDAWTGSGKYLLSLTSWQQLIHYKHDFNFFWPVWVWLVNLPYGPVLLYGSCCQISDCHLEGLCCASCLVCRTIYLTWQIHNL